MTPETIEQLHAAKIPLVEGMEVIAVVMATKDKKPRLVRIDRIEDNGNALVLSARYWDRDKASWTYIQDPIPNLEDRTTYLLCCDELERREPDLHMTWYRSLRLWDYSEDEKQARIESLAHVLLSLVPL